MMARAVEIREPPAARHPNDAILRNGLWTTYWLTGSVQEEHDDALAHEYALRAITERESKNQRLKTEPASSLTRLGQAKAKLESPRAALPHLEQAAGMYLEVSERSPDDHRRFPEEIQASVRRNEGQ